MTVSHKMDMLIFSYLFPPMDVKCTVIVLNPAIAGGAATSAVDVMAYADIFLPETWVAWGLVGAVLGFGCFILSLSKGDGMTGSATASATLLFRCCILFATARSCAGNICISISCNYLTMPLFNEIQIISTS